MIWPIIIANYSIKAALTRRHGQEAITGLDIQVAMSATKSAVVCKMPRLRQLPSVVRSSQHERGEGVGLWGSTADVQYLQ